MSQSLIGCHALVWTGNFDKAGIIDSVVRTHKAGFDLIEFPLMDPDTFDIPAARQALADTGLAVSASLGLPEDEDISSDDPAVVEAGRRRLLSAVDVAAGIGATQLCGVIYGSMRKHMDPLSEKGWANSVEALRAVADHAAAAGVSLAVEVVNRYETNMLNTGKQALRFIESLDRPVTVHLDTYHMNIEESDLFQPFLDCSAQLGYVHIGESHRGYLGTGSVDFESTFKALGRIGYTGPITFESFSSAVVSPSLSRMLGIWRNLWDDSDHLAAHANRFIRDHIAAVETISLH